MKAEAPRKPSTQRPQRTPRILCDPGVRGVHKLFSKLSEGLSALACGVGKPNELHKARDAVALAGVSTYMHARTFIALLLLNAGTGTVLGAQARSTGFVDLSFGASVRGGGESLAGEYFDRGSAFGLLTFGAQPDRERSFLLALRVGFLGIPSGGDVCRLTPADGCYQNFPLGGIIALTAGARPLSTPWRALEVTTGPALIGHFEGGSSYGLLSTVRFGTPPGFYFSMGLAFHGIVTTVDGTPFIAGGFGISLRSW